MFHPDLREEIRYLNARLLYKTKKRDEALAEGDNEKATALLKQIQEIEEKIEICNVKVGAEDLSNAHDQRESSKG